MRILIIDVTRDYGLFTPFEKPMGGLQSGVCYLTRQLSLQGHELTIVNGCAEEHLEEGVRFIPWTNSWTDASEMDAIIVTAASSDMMAAWQDAYGRKPMWLLWVHYDVDQTAIHILKNPLDRDRFDGFLFVSEWQVQVFRETFGIGWDRAFVMRNAVSPVFHELYQPGEAILPVKSPAPLFVYTSTPYRGLAPLMDAVPLIIDRVPDARFQIFSSWAVYGRSDAEDPHQDLYDRCRTTPGVDYIGGVPQKELAQYLKKAWAVAYPSIFRETSCIAVMEGLASGCKVITSHLAALPETTGGFGELIINPENDEDLARRFADRAVRVVEDFRNRPVEIERELQASVAHARSQLTWSLRATQLGEWLSARRILMLRAQKEAAPARVQSLSPTTQLVLGRHGAFIVEAGDGCLVSRTLGMVGQWLESALSLALGTLRPGDKVIEVGAHLGAMTVPIAKAVGPEGRVYAFEAQPDFARRLETNLQVNGLTQVEVRGQLAGDGDSWSLEPFSAPLPGVAWVWGHLRRTQGGTPSTPLDQLLGDLDACRLVKISAPGMADRVLEGMLGLVVRTRPLMLIEISSDAEFLALRTRLQVLGYYLHWQCSELFPADNAFQAELPGLPPLAILHVLAVPAGSGLYSQQHPALFLRDPDQLFPDKALVFRQTGLEEPVIAVPKGEIAAFDGDGDGLLAKWRDNLLLNAHLPYILAHGHGGGSVTGHALWAEVLAGLPADGPAALLVMGEATADVVSLWALLAKGWGRSVVIDMAQSDGFPSQQARDKLGLLVWIFALQAESFRYVSGPGLVERADRYDMIYCLNVGDAAMAASLLKPGGLLVLNAGLQAGKLSGLRKLAASPDYDVFTGA